MSRLPKIDLLPKSSAEERAKVLDLLFEPCTQLHTLSIEILGTTTFGSYNELADTVGNQMHELNDSRLESDHQWLDAILVAHPRLGEKKVDSAQSRAEQAQLQGGQEENERLAALNMQYEEKFPGLRYVVFVNGRSRDVIMQDMQRRIDSADIKQERTDAIEAMVNIAKDRATKLTV